MALRLKKKDIAYMLNVNVRTIENWQQKGSDPLPFIPAEKNGLPNTYDPQLVVAWYMDQEIEKLITTEDGNILILDQQRARLASAQADGHELKNKVTRRELAPVYLLTFALDRVASQINAIFESIPLKVKKRLPKLTTARKNKLNYFYILNCCFN